MLKDFVLRSCLLGLFVALLSPLAGQAVEFTRHSPAAQQQIADLIFNNECNRQYDCLVSWNEGESFASLGIGHFIWFPQGSKAPFQESFPDLLRWFEAQGIALPLGLSPDSPCLWQDKIDFSQQDSQRDIAILRSFLQQTKVVQAQFIMARLEQSLPKMLATLSKKSEGNHVKQQFLRLTASAKGWYVLADYVNFKGEGIKLSERYQGQGWGLLQVLLLMQGTSNAAASAVFVAAASQVLKQRVKNAPPKRNEQRWLSGWMKRLKTYL